MPRVKTQYLTYEEAAKYLRLSVRTVKRLKMDGILKAFQRVPRGTVRFTVQQLDNYMNRHEQPVEIN